MKKVIRLFFMTGIAFIGIISLPFLVPFFFYAISKLGMFGSFMISMVLVAIPLGLIAIGILFARSLIVKWNKKRENPYRGIYDEIKSNN